jgi:hypothetical protein
MCNSKHGRASRGVQSSSGRTRLQWVAAALSVAKASLNDAFGAYRRLEAGVGLEGCPVECRCRRMREGGRLCTVYS